MCFTIGLTSCLVGPDYKGPTAPHLPATWVNDMPPQTKEGDLSKWWNQFGDQQLNQFLKMSFDHNPDMIQAALNIAKAERILGTSVSGLYPMGSISAGGSNAGNYDTSTSHARWNSALSASWTPDIWGGTRHEIEASFASLGSSIAAAAATRTALASGVASSYFQWIMAKENLRVAREQLSYQERTHGIVQQLFSNGFKAQLDLEESRSNIETTRATIPEYEANIKKYENALAIYLGTTVDKLKIKMPIASVYNKIPSVPMNLPADLLRRRPDVIQAEMQLHRSTSLIGVSVANLFPRISLTGSTSSSAGTDFAQFWSSAGWSLVGNASQTIFNRSALNNAVDLAKLNTLSEGQSYRKTVLAAFAEVEVELIDYARLLAQIPSYERANAANKKAAEFSLRLYNVGNTDFLNVASAERAWLASELRLIMLRQQARITLARLCTAMGGGY